MDAMPIDFGTEIEAWVQALEEAEKTITNSLKVLKLLPLGGTAVGTGVNTHPDFAAKMTAHLSEA